MPVVLLAGSFCPVRSIRHYGRVLKAQTDYDAQVLAGNLPGQSAEGARFLECTFQRCDLSQARLAQSHSQTPACMPCTAPRSTSPSRPGWTAWCRALAGCGPALWRRTAARALRGMQDRVGTFNLRGATLVDCQLVDCQLVEPRLRRGRRRPPGLLEGSRLVTPEFTHARLSEVDLSAAELAAPAGCPACGGPPSRARKLLDLAPAFAAELGVVQRGPSEQRRRAASAAPTVPTLVPHREGRRALVLHGEQVGRREQLAQGRVAVVRSRSSTGWRCGCRRCRPGPIPRRPPLPGPRCGAA